MRLLTLFTALFLVGCTATLPIMQTPETSPDQATEAWSRVLQRHLQEDGRVDYRGLETDMGDLSAVVRFTAAGHLKEFADEQARTAALINAYNALSLYNVLMAEKPEDLDSWFARTNFFKWRRYAVFGELLSLDELRAKILEETKDPRVVFALISPDAGAPRLPREPFVGSHLDSQLDRQAKAFLNEPRNVWVDPIKRKVHVSSVIPDDAPVDLINRYREKPVPEEYSVEAIPRDWSIYETL